MKIFLWNISHFAFTLLTALRSQFASPETSQNFALADTKLNRHIPKGWHKDHSGITLDCAPGDLSIQRRRSNHRDHLADGRGLLPRCGGGTPSARRMRVSSRVASSQVSSSPFTKASTSTSRSRV